MAEDKNGLNSYELSRNFFDFSFSNPEKIKPNHVSVYFFAIEHCNRLGWKEKFGFPSQMVMEAVGIKNWRTYSSTLSDLIDFGFLKMIEISKNQYSSNIIAIVKNTKAQSKALDKALQKHGTKQRRSIDSIDKQYNNITKNNNYNTLLEIKDFNAALSDFDGDKKFFYLAYRYWQLWKKEYPNHKHLNEAKVKDWYDAIRLMIERDKQTIDRLVAIYIFLTKSQAKDRGYETFLFTQVKSLPALRKNTSSGEYRLDNLAAMVNEKLEKDSGFNSEVGKAIKQFKTKFQ